MGKEEKKVVGVEKGGKEERDEKADVGEKREEEE
mgnify:CR=1 FL=1